MASDIHALRLEEKRWRDIAAIFIGWRDTAQHYAGEESVMTTASRDQREAFRRAAKSLGPSIAEAMRGQEECRRRIDELDPPSALPDFEPMTDEQIMQLGKEVADDPTLGGMMRQGRPLTNMEMVAYANYVHEDALTRFAREWLAMAEDAQQESALAAVAARLSDGHPLTGEVSYV